MNESQNSPSGHFDSIPGSIILIKYEPLDTNSVWKAASSASENKNAVAVQSAKPNMAHSEQSGLFDQAKDLKSASNMTTSAREEVVSICTSPKQLAFDRVKTTSKKSSILTGGE